MKIAVSANFAWNIQNRQNLIQAFKMRGWDVFAVSVQDGCEVFLRDTLGIPFIPLQVNNSGVNVFSDIAVYRQYKRIYAQEKPDIVLHFNNKPNIYGGKAASDLHIPSIANITGLGTAFEKKGLLQTLLSFLYRQVFKSSLTFAFFQNIDDRIMFFNKKIIAESKTALLPGSGVDIEKYQPQAVLPKKETVDFVFSGRLVKTKGIAEYIAAAEQIKKTHTNAVFHIIGDIEQSNRFITKQELDNAVASESVIYHGQVKNPAVFLETIDCVVLPSYYREGVPRVLLEGAAMGKPLIGANSPGTREPIEDTKNGFLCTPKSAASLTKVLQVFLDLSPEERQKMGQYSRKIAVERFSDRIVIERYIQRILALTCGSESVNSEKKEDVE